MPGFRRFAALLTAVACVALSGPMVMSGQAPAPEEFDVASVLPENIPRNYIRTQVNGRTFVAEGASAAVLIRYAYDLKDFQLTGGPDWMYDRETQFSLHATFTGDATVARVRGMVRRLLADRFSLRAHDEQKTGDLFELSAARGGPKLTPSKQNTPARRGCSPYPAICTDVTMAEFADYLSAVVLGNLVLDKTALPGRYDLKVTWSPDNSQFRGNGGTGFFSGDGPSLFTAVQEQIGLQLKPLKGPIPILEVDTIAAPSPN